MAAKPKKENPIRHRINANKAQECYICGEHMTIDGLKKKNIENGYIKNKVPNYPRPVEFHCSKVSHVTTTDGMEGILDLKGFRGGDGEMSLLWWGTVIGESEITAAEERYLEKSFPTWTPDERKREKGFLCEFTTSPVFNERSRYGNFRFTFSLAEVMDAYKSQFCDGEEPVLNVYKTIIYKQEIMYVLLIHSPEVKIGKDYPELGDNDEGVCAYKDGKIIWRAQAISHSHNFKMIVDEAEREVNVEGAFNAFYVWDHVTLAFHMPTRRNLVFPPEMLLRSLTACGGAVNFLNPVIGKVKAGKIVQEKRDNANLEL